MVWTIKPLVAVTVTVKVPVAVPPLDETVSVAVGVPPDVTVMLVGTSEIVGFFLAKTGVIDADRETDPLNPFRLVIVSIELPDCPTWMTIDEGLEVREKVGDGGTTVKTT